MTYRVRVSHGAMARPAEVYDLDEPEGWRAMEGFLDLLTMDSIVHLYEGESVTIECIERDDQEDGA